MSDSTTSARLHQLLVEWNDNGTTWPGRLLLHELFSAQAERTPDAVAVADDAGHLSFRELDLRGRQLELRREGIGPESVVGLLLERSPDMVAAQLGVLRSGAAFLPLDPSYPKQRLAFMVDDARPRVVLTEGHLIDRRPSRDRLEPPRIHGDNPAYVLYTSGSTGRPKAVVISHRAICNHRLWMQTALPLGPGDRVLQKAPLGFDASVWEIWAPLVAGARLVLAQPERPGDPGYLVDVLREQRITVLHVVPALLEMLTSQPGFGDCRELRRVCCGGDVLSAKLRDRFFAERPGTDLVNLYGPAEATIQSATDLCRPSGPVALGRPIANARIHVLDRGEIHVGGAGLARGYLHRPRLTAERFVPDPFSDGGRLYKTGDRGRFLPDGRLEFLGRLDRQVKIRGFRVELGEVEAELARHPEVARAVVLAGPRGLAACVVTGEDESELRAYLLRRLPEFMVPATFHVLDALPLTAHGKVDHEALSRTVSRHKRRAIGRRPGSASEKALADLWQEMLELAPIGAEETWTDLGGDSILGARLIHRLQDALGETLFVSALFEAPTVARLAAYLEDHYASSLAAWLGGDVPDAGASTRVTSADAVRLRRLAASPCPLSVASGAKNPPAVFVLSPPRSGSTLFRIMLAGHPKLFSPPALALLQFETLRERRATCVGRLSFLLEGTLRALMELRGCTVEEAEQLMADWERRDLAVKQLYRLLQDEIGDRLLVDKTSGYAIEPAAPRRAERDFEGAMYLHLVRHPCAMIHSYQEARIDRVFRWDNPFSPRQLAR